MLIPFLCLQLLLVVVLHAAALSCTVQRLMAFDENQLRCT